MKQRYKLLGIMLTAATLAGCGKDGSTTPIGMGGDSGTGGSGAGGEPGTGLTFTPQTAPAIELTILNSSLTVLPGDTVYLQALAYGGLGDSSYQWTQTSGPSVSILGANTLNPSFVAPAASATSELEFTLTVTDSTGAAETGTVTVTVSVNALTANAGGDQSAVVGQTIQLHGSVAGGEGAATYAWKQTAGTAVTLSQATSLNPAFTTTAANAGETLTFELTGTQGGASATDTVDIVISSGTLSVDAGADVTASETQLVYLHAIADSPLTDVTYQWKPVDPNVIVLSGKKTPNPSFVAPVVDTETVLSWEVTVTDGAGNGPETDTVSVTVSPQLPTVTVAPVAAVAETEDVQLEVEASGGFAPYTYAWTQVVDGASTGTLSDATIANPVLTAPDVATKETLTFQCAVTDAVGHVVTVSTEVHVYDNVPAAPLAVDLGPNTGAVDFVTLQEGQLGSLTVAVTGGTPPYAITWSQPDAGTEPDLGLTVPVTDPGRAVFAAPPVDVNSLANVIVSVTDSGPGQGDTVTDTVTVTVQNRPMAVSAGPDRAVYVNSDVSLHANTSFTTGAVGYTWTQLSGPTTVSLTAAGSSNASFAPTIAGVYEFQVAAKDRINSSTDTIQITVQSPGITVSAGTDQTVAPGNTVRLTSQASGLPPFTFVWTQTAGPNVPLADLNTSNPFFIAPTVTTNTTLSFQVDLQDGAGATTSDSVDILITAVPALTADAGLNQSAVSGKSVSLHGSASGGAAGGYTYLWTAPSGVVLSDATSSNPTFVAPQMDGGLDFTLTVKDSGGASATSSTTVAVQVPKMDCTTCDGLTCLLGPTRGICTGDDDVCYTTIRDNNERREIERGCVSRKEAAVPPAACDEVESHVLAAGVECTYYCDGGQYPNCNKPPQLVPENASRLPTP